MTQDPAAAAPQDTPPAAASAGADDDELLIDGQEEVFSRTEVERGMIEHHSLEEAEPKPERRVVTPVDPDEAMAENFQATFNPRP